MAKSDFAVAVDEIQAALRPFMKERGFRVRGRTFNRVNEDGLTEAVNLEMGRSDPPGTTYIAGFRENFHGFFRINLGVYVPEVALYLHGIEAKSWVQEYECCVRTQIPEASEEDESLWWPASANNAVINDVRDCMASEGMVFLDRFSTRDKIICEWKDRSTNMGASAHPRMVLAIILAERGEKLRARELLARQASKSDHAMQREFVRELATKLHLGTFND